MNIPDEVKNSDETRELKRVLKEFFNALEELQSFAGVGPEHPGHTLALRRMEEASSRRKKAEEVYGVYLAALGLPRPVDLSPVVIERIKGEFPLDQQQEVIELLRKECGRNIAGFDRAGDIQFQQVHLGVLKRSKGDISKLRKFIDVAKEDYRDVC